MLDGSDGIHYQLSVKVQSPLSLRRNPLTSRQTCVAPLAADRLLALAARVFWRRWLLEAVGAAGCLRLLAPLAAIYSHLHTTSLKLTSNPAPE